MPISTLKAMLSAKDCRIRIRSENGTINAIFTSEKIQMGQQTAIVPLRVFIKRVEEYKSKK